MASPAFGPPRQAPVTLLASDRLVMAGDLDTVPLIDRARRGAVAVRVRPGPHHEAQMLTSVTCPRRSAVANPGTGRP